MTYTDQGKELRASTADLEWILLQVELADIEALSDPGIGNSALRGYSCDASYRGYRCTRIPGHPGIHAAGGIRGRVEKRWLGGVTPF